MPTPSPPPLPKRPPDFFHSYGIAMAQWAYVELRLSQWFEELTGMSEDMARTIFFSARSFQGRSDMVDAAIRETERLELLHEPTRELLELAITKAVAYSGTRNAMAHGLVVGHLGDDGSFTSRIVQGKHRVEEHRSVGLTLDEINVAERNFQKLASILIRGLKAHRAKDQLLLQECLEQARLLPSEAGSQKLSRNQAGRERQRQAALRKAKKQRLMSNILDT